MKLKSEGRAVVILRSTTIFFTLFLLIIGVVLYNQNKIINIHEVEILNLENKLLEMEANMDYENSEGESKIGDLESRIGDLESQVYDLETQDEELEYQIEDLDYRISDLEYSRR